MGAIQALEQIVEESRDRYYWQVAALLTAYVRESAPLGGNAGDKPREDIQAAISVLGRQISPLGRTRVKQEYPNTNLAGAVFGPRRLDDANFKKAILNGAIFSNMTLSGVKFEEAHAENARFIRAELGNVDFVNCVLSGSNFSSARFEEVNFRSANLQRVSYRRAITNQSGFFDSDGEFHEKPGADFFGADLTGADFRGAGLHFAEGLTKDQLCSAVFDEETRFPDGKSGRTKAEVEAWSGDQCKAAGLFVDNGE